MVIAYMAKCANVNGYAQRMEDHEENFSDHTVKCTHVK